ncbi:putative Serine protease 56 [Hypsibius exemplaris]|uniref:Serine protease 56 n=1 Tax=Hypsibius exemplaris TaxID=2072580 RepID=A0A9X6RLL0_HYPEX|nr:putative Serine protease 56 [Hypsibius exemplaris]
MDAIFYTVMLTAHLGVCGGASVNYAHYDEQPMRHCGSVGTGSNSDLFPVTQMHHRALDKAGLVSPTIVGGSMAVRNQICWQVSIAMGCGGTIIGERTILTAAHCFVDDKGEQGILPRDVMVLTGSLHWLDTPSNDSTGCAEEFGVSAIAVHPEYDPSTSDNDIAIVKLDRAIVFEGKPCVCRMCLADQEPKVGEICVASGNGLEFEGDDSNDPLKFLNLPVRNNVYPDCSFTTNENETRSTNPDLFVCAGGIVGEDSCQGDSGGPLVCLNRDGSNLLYLAGIVSFGEGCGGPIGAQYTKVKPFLPWIRENALPDIV